jgi:hypothetical protein
MFELMLGIAIGVIGYPVAMAAIKLAVSKVRG